MEAAKCASPLSKYILFLDANCRLHPGTVYAMVQELETDQAAYVATGYPFDVPPPGATLWCYTVAQFRWAALSEFMSARSTFVWGGAMLLRRDDIESNLYKLMDYWVDGGYSDDMQVQACAQDNQRTIATPLCAVFPNTLKRAVTASYCWDFLLRQNFVLYTYSTGGHFRRHMFLLFAYTVPNGLWLPASLLTLATILEAPIAIVLCPVEALLAPARLIHWAVTLGFVLAFAVALLALKCNLRAIADMCRALSPEEPKEALSLKHLSNTKLAAALVMQSALAPCVTLRNLAVPTINWGGILYTRSRGRIVRIFRPPPPPSSSDLSSHTQGIAQSDGDGAAAAAATAAALLPPLAPPVTLAGEVVASAWASASASPQLPCRSAASHLLDQQQQQPEPDMPPLRHGSHPPMRSSWFPRSWEISALDEQSDLMSERNESPVSIESQSPRRHEHASTASLRHVAHNLGGGGGGGTRGRAATSSSADIARQASARGMNRPPAASCSATRPWSQLSGSPTHARLGA